MSLPFLIVLVYYDRPELVRNALQSIKNQTYDNWKLAFIDDGSPNPGKPVVEEILCDHLDKVTFYHCDDTPEQKNLQGGSRHPQYMNMAIYNEELDPETIVVVLCDDDALTNGYLRSLNSFYTNAPEIMYSFCHVIPFDPTAEVPSIDMIERECGLNHQGPVHPFCQVDSSQVSFRRRALVDKQFGYPSPSTKNNDAALFAQLANYYGLCTPNFIRGQYKGLFFDQLGNRNGHLVYETRKK